MERTAWSSLLQQPDWQTLKFLVIEHFSTHPFHVCLETGLVLFIAYILFAKRAYNPAKRGYGRRGKPQLTDKEEEALLEEWQPQQLVPDVDGSEGEMTPWLLKSFTPTPAAPMRVLIEGDDAPKTLWTSADYLGFGAGARAVAAARSTLDQFSLGSCGPRGFYGTTTVHLDLEAALARFMGSHESITYSDDTATIVSVIPAFAKRGDVLLIDSAANYGVQQGAHLSRSKVVWWNHNDTADLERHLRAVREADSGKSKGAALQQRRFIVVEGLYASTGELCPLPEIMRLAAEYKWRIILDDRLSFGVLGATGRGTAEHFGISPGDVAVTVGSLSTTLGSVGGFCVGSREVVDHQRLSGAGYCFSASAPPFLCAVATAALGELRDAPASVAALRARSAAVHRLLDAACRSGGCAGLVLVSDELSPTKHLVLGDARKLPPTAPAPAPAPPAPSVPLVVARMLSPTTQRLESPSHEALRDHAREGAVLAQLVKSAAAAGVLVARSHTIPSEPFRARPTLKLHVTLRHTDADVTLLVEALSKACQEVL